MKVTGWRNFHTRPLPRTPHCPVLNLSRRASRTERHQAEEDEPVSALRHPPQLRGGRCVASRHRARVDAWRVGPGITRRRGNAACHLPYQRCVGTLHTYRFLSAFLALSLVLTVTLPLVRHSCGMTAAEMAMKPCCKDKAGRHVNASVPEHHGERAYREPVANCHDAPASNAPETPYPPDTPYPDAPIWSALYTTCCTNVEAPAAPTAERVQPLQASLLAVVAAVFSLAPEPSSSPPREPSATASAAPVALHVLYGRFLT